MRRVRLAFWLTAALLFVVGPTAARWYTDWLWFGELGYLRVYWVPLLSRIAVTAAVGAAVWLLLAVNIRPLLRAARTTRVIDMKESGGRYRASLPRWGLLSAGAWNWAAAGVALLAGLSASGEWVMFQQFVHATPFGGTDPIFGRDVGFYVFRLPVYRFVAEGLFTWLALITVGAAVAYGAIHGHMMLRGLWIGPANVRAHLSLLLGSAVIVRGVGFWLDAFEILYSPRGPAFGASFTDVNAVLPALRILSVLFVICGLLLLANARLRTARLAIWNVALIAVAWAVGLAIYPGLVQALRVRPSELTAETPYIRNAIAGTLRGFGLEAVREREFPNAPLDAAAISRNTATMQNVRLWDYRPLQLAFGQLQTLRPYYAFQDVDIDRYVLDGSQRQVMLSAREIAPGRLAPQARTWVNEHLVYTHGYGLVMAPVNRVSEEGMPEFLIRDIPPQAVQGLAVSRPEIYYGELTGNYVIVNTAVRELDYPQGDENVYTRYAGRGGIRLGYLARLGLAYRFGDLRLAISTDIGRDSRLLFERQITKRVLKIAPFLRLDRDPYLVLADGRLVWVIDAYTATDRFPYSTRYGGISYIRNSVKVVVDAYDGAVSFYTVLPDEPIARTLSRIFPELFRPIEQMPAAVRAHLRYPVDLFEIQAQVYSTFHMRDPQVFYNREDVWATPREVFGREPVAVEPYYVTMRLAEGSAPEFILMLPLVPAGRDNMIAWMAARNDPPHYGELVVYRFPKARIIFGPMQVEARIDQDPVISQQLTLWNQLGSQVIRGNLLVIPIEDGLLYVEPLFLQAERSQLPELKRVIVASGPRIVMAPTLEGALGGLFGGRAVEAAPPPTPRPGAEPSVPAAPGTPEQVAALVDQALQTYRAAQERLRAGDLAGYGREIERLGQTLERLREASRQR